MTIITNMIKNNIIENINNLIMVINDKDNIIYINDMFTQKLGYKIEDINNISFTQIIHKNNRGNTYEKYQLILNNKNNNIKKNIDNYLLIKDKNDKINISWEYWKYENNVIYIGNININEQIILKQIVKSLNDYLYNDKSIYNIFNTLLNCILELTDSEYGFIGEVHYDKDDNPWLKTMAITNIAWNEKLQKQFEKNEIEFRNLDTLFGECLKTKKIIISNDPLNDKRRGGKSKLPEGHPPINRLCCIPFFYDNIFIGMCGIANAIDDYKISKIKEYEIFFNTCANLINHLRQTKISESILNNNIKFISQISHELKTPLNAILGFAQLLDMENNEYASYILESGKILMNIIQNSLNLNKLDTYIINYDILDINEIIENILYNCKIEITKKNITVEKNILNNCKIKCDKFLINTIIKNLITNAIKYNKQNGYIKIENYIKENENCIKITNSGKIKISENELFKAFSTSDNVNGTGLGLSMVKKIMNILKKEITYENDVKNEEVSFIVSFDNNINKSNNNNKINILYIEDNKFNQILMTKIFNDKNNINLTIRENGANLLKYINKYDLLLLDWHLNTINTKEEQLDGIDIVNILIKNDIKIKLCVLTADTHIETINFLNSKNIKYLNKPLNINKFKEMLKNLDIII